MKRYWIFNGTIYDENTAQTKSYIKNKGLAIWAQSKVQAKAQQQSLIIHGTADHRLTKNS